MTVRKRFDPRRALARTALALAAGCGVAFALDRFAGASWRLSALSGWLVAGSVLLGLAGSLILSADAKGTQARAASEDPGRTAVYALVLLASTTSLLAATVLVGLAKHLAGFEGRALVLLCLGTVAVSWTLTHTSFALRYAHLYYREDDEGVGGAEFPGGAPPAYFEFAYLAFTVGMCFQVSDTVITSPQLRRGVLLHALLSFAYNTTILAFVLNLVFGFAG